MMNKMNHRKICDCINNLYRDVYKLADNPRTYEQAQLLCAIDAMLHDWKIAVGMNEGEYQMIKSFKK